MTPSARYLAALRAQADDALRAAGVPADIGAEYGGVARALVHRAVGLTQIGRRIEDTLAALVREEIAAHKRAQGERT